MAKKKPIDKGRERTLLVKDKDGEFKITLPPGARVTFGPDVPFAPKGGNFTYHEGAQQRRYSLRVYEGAGNDTLVACFSAVEWFRDLAMPLGRLVLRESGTSVWRNDETGYEVNTKVTKDHAFVDAAKLITGSE